MRVGTRVSWLAGLLLASACAIAASPTPKPGTAATWRDSVDAFAKERFRHPAWGYTHSARDYALARELAARDGVTLDDDVLFAAAYLHDIAAFQPWEVVDQDHADVAADIIDSVLNDTGFPMAKIEAVRAAIRTHMYDRKPVGPEAVYLHDADALDWLGAIGVARVLALVDSAGGPPDGPAMVKFLEENLTGVPGGVVSPAGRAMVPARQTELAKFIENLRAQSGNLEYL